MQHPFDEWDEQGAKSREEFLKQALIDSSLVYQVFSTQAGERLLDRWKSILMFSPTATRGEDQISIGMNEGYKAFIRSIILAIKTHEDNS